MSLAAEQKTGDAQTQDTLSERAAARLERDILAGAFAPGARLGIVDLAQRYDIGATPLREGLSRLVSRGLIVAVGQRGFRVADVSRNDLLDITRMRIVVEAEALRLSIEFGDDNWEADILATLHRLKRYVHREGERFREGTVEFDVLHKGFHTSLLQACGSQRLLSAHSDLYDQAYRYRRVLMSVIADGDEFVKMHEALAGKVLARDVGAAQSMLAKHLNATLDYVYPFDVKDQP